jgi:hypothetical protein
MAFAACLLVGSGRARDVEVNATGISIPFFSPAGKLTHRLTATHGTKAGELQKLKEVELVYFSATKPNEIVQKLVATDATWDDKKEVLRGDGALLIATEENRITGDGFDFTLATALVHIHRQFKMENSELLVTSDRATVELIMERNADETKVRDVKRCEATGHLEIVVQPTAKKRYDFTKAYSETAIYEGATRVIEFPQTVRYTRKDGTPASSNMLTIKLPPAHTGKKK